MRFDDYPTNLLREVCPEIEAENERPEDFSETLAYILAGMPPRRKDVLLARFKDGKTLSECAGRYNVNRERIRQIECKALAYLREPAQQRYLKHGMKGIIAQETEAAYRRARDETTKLFEQEINNLKEKTNREITVDSIAKGMSVSDMGLSVRACHALGRRGCETVYDVLRLTPEEFWETRNLGKKTGAEVIAKLREMHFDCDRLANTRRY